MADQKTPTTLDDVIALTQKVEQANMELATAEKDLKSATKRLDGKKTTVLGLKAQLDTAKAAFTAIKR